MYFDIKGFRATWKEVTNTGTVEEGAIKSPNFPNDYPNNKDQVHFRIEIIIDIFIVSNIGMGSLCFCWLKDTTDLQFL